MLGERLFYPVPVLAIKNLACNRHEFLLFGTHVGEVVADVALDRAGERLEFRLAAGLPKFDTRSDKYLKT